MNVSKSIRGYGVLWMLVVLLFVVAIAATAGEVASFTLVNASTDADVMTLADGAAINLARAGNQLNIRANISGPAKTVNLTLSGAMSQTRSEGVAPYALYGDSGGDYRGWTPVAGTYTLTANCDGAGAKTITFTVIDGGIRPPRFRCRSRGKTVTEP